MDAIQQYHRNWSFVQVIFNAFVQRCNAEIPEKKITLFYTLLIAVKIDYLLQGTGNHGKWIKR